VRRSGAGIGEFIIHHADYPRGVRYFFTGLENSIWIQPLDNDGIFFKPSDPIEVNPGSFQLPGWSIGEYLARFADLHEDIVGSVVRSIRTENWWVQEILVDAML
jgi:hypothetical protein